MTRATSRQRRRSAVRPAGAWRRFFVALAALIAVFVGVPVLLVMCARAGLDASHPFPGIGSSDEIKAFFERDLTPTEIAPIAMRALLIIGWMLWLGLVMSVLASIFEARGSALRSLVPQFAMFAGIGRWIAAGLTAITSLTPNFVSAATLASPRPFTVSSITPEQAVAIEAPVQPGFARVQRGESIETFAQRLLGDASRWPEIWELNKNQVVGPDGEVWSAAWRLGAGWDLRLPADAVPSAPTAAPFRAQPSRAAIPGSPSAWAQRERLRVVDEYEVVEGDSFWAIAESFLPAGASGHDVWEFTQALMTFNAPRLGHDHPAMLHPGDIVEIVAIEGAQTPVSPAGENTDPNADGTLPTYAVVAGDSYWEIAEDALGDDATPQAVLQLTGELIDLNSPILDYTERRMIHPGDVVYLEEAPPPDDPAPAIPPSVLNSDVDALAVAELPPPAPVAATTPVTTSTTTTTSTLPPPVDPAPPIEADGNDDSGFPSSPIGLGQAALIATGVVALLAARRRARLRAAEAPARIPLPRPEAANTERMLRRVDASERLLRIDIALRAAAAQLANGDQRVVVVRCAPDGAIELLLSAPAELAAPWIGAGQRWSIGGEVPVDDLAASARAVGAPCVALTQLGVDTDEWDVLVDLEATGMLAIDADPETADAVARALAVGLASSEFAEVAHLVGVGIDEGAFLGHRHAQVVPTVDEAIELAATLIGTTTKSTRTTFSLRARHTSGEMWEPAVVIIAAANASELTPAVTRSVSSRSGLAIVMAAPMEGSSWTLRPDGEAWTLDPLGIRVQPIGVDAEELDDLVEAIGLDFDDVVDADDHDAPAQPVVAIDAVPEPPAASDLGCFEPPRLANGGNGNGNGHHDALGAATLLYPSPVADAANDVDDACVEPPWSLMVTLLASPEVIDRDRRPARFERSKTLELVTWLVTHRGRSTRSAARTALWDLDVRDATFANVVSEARRVMARHVTPPDGDEWLLRTLTDELTLHPEVIADSDIVRARLDRARRVGGDAALAMLRPAVELVTNLPFAGTGYLWPDAEGITSNLVLLATSVTAEYAKLALANGDADGVFWATGRGLQVLAGQESLIALRMRAHAEAGDLSGVRLEWESYERVLTGDPWSDGEPAAKLVALRKELLSH